MMQLHPGKAEEDERRRVKVPGGLCVSWAGAAPHPSQDFCAGLVLCVLTKEREALPLPGLTQLLLRALCHLSPLTGQGTELGGLLV